MTISKYGFGSKLKDLSYVDSLLCRQVGRTEGQFDGRVGENNDDGELTVCQIINIYYF